MSDHLRIPSAFWEGIQRIGLVRQEVITRAQLPLRVLQGDAPVSTQQFFSLWEAVEEVSQNPTIGLSLATALDAAVMPPSFLAAYYARDYRDALQRVARFKRLCAPEAIILEEYSDRSDIQLRWSYAEDDILPPALVDASLASLLELGRQGTGVPLVPLSVSLARAPFESEVHERYFGCSVKFGAAQNCMTMRRTDLDRLFLNYNTALLEILDHALESQMEKHVNSGSLSAQIRWILRRCLTAGRPDIRTVASELAMSGRSLQRHLTDEGVSFQGLLSQTRHQLALEYLTDASLSLMEVAYMLGYEDQNSFFRAFRQWEACTPSEWRTKNEVLQ